MEPTDVLRELFEEAIPSDPREPELKRRLRTTVAGAKARLAIDRLESLGYAIVPRQVNATIASNQSDDYPVTHARTWG
ncbi:MAG: hypothetical protein H6842_01240 [Rhodospirillaceae bacterium]|nr:hypothetical protein [Rhodospirillaceae bacterium]